MAERGGRRAGAGRPRLLTPDQEQEIGQACERRYEKLIVRRFRKKVDALSEQYVEDWTELRKVGTADRTRVTALAYSDIDEEEFPADAPDEVATLRQIHETLDRRARFHHVRVSPKRGIAKQIENVVARAFSQKLHMNIKPRHVRTCWGRYRKLEDRIRRELEEEFFREW